MLYLQQLFLPIKTMTQNNDRYEWLACNKLFYLNIEKNPHKNNRMSVIEHISNSSITTGIYDGLAKEDIQKMIDSDTIWEVQVYPDNPIGFSIYTSHDFNIAVDRAIADYPLE